MELTSPLVNHWNNEIVIESELIHKEVSYSILVHELNEIVIESELIHKEVSYSILVHELMFRDRELFALNVHVSVPDSLCSNPDLSVSGAEFFQNNGNDFPIGKTLK